MAIDLVEGDTGTVLGGMVRDKATKQPVDGTGASVVLRWTIDGGAPVERAMTIVSANHLRVSYQFGAGELAVPAGERSFMRVNAVVTDAGGKVLTQVKPKNYTIRKKI